MIKDKRQIQIEAPSYAIFDFIEKLGPSNSEDL